MAALQPFRRINAHMGYDSLSEAELMARVVEGDRRALETLYDRSASSALGLALKILGERALAEEVVQEAFWRVWQRSSTFVAGRGQFNAWLLGIVHNLCIDELRRRRSRPVMASTDSEDDEILDLPDEAMDVAETAFQRVTGQQVRTAIQSLPEAQRQVIELAFYEGLTHQEIAERLTEPVGTVHTRARLALQKLRESLQSLHLDQV